MKNSIGTYVALAVLLPVTGALSAASLPAVFSQFGNGNTRIEQDQFIAGTGIIERRWKLTNQGLVATVLKSTGKTNRERILIGDFSDKLFETTAPIYPGYKFPRQTSIATRTSNVDELRIHDLNQYEIP